MLDCPFLDWEDSSSLYYGPLSPFLEDTHSSLVEVRPSPSSVDEYCSIEGLSSSHNTQPAVFFEDTQLDSISPASQQILPFEPGIMILPPVPQTPLPPPASPVPLPSAGDTIEDTIEVSRRRPGRPSGTGRRQHPSEKIVRKHLHNASASKSRARFSAALDKLWDQVPEHKLTTTNPSRPLTRNEKVDITLAYMKELQTKLGQERRLNDGKYSARIEN